MIARVADSGTAVRIQSARLLLPEWVAGFRAELDHFFLILRCRNGHPPFIDNDVKRDVWQRTRERLAHNSLENALLLGVGHHRLMIGQQVHLHTSAAHVAALKTWRATA